MLIDGKKLAEKLLSNLKKEVEAFIQKTNIIPHLGVIVVGDDAATASYVRQKKRMGEQSGIIVSVYNYPLDITQEELLEHIIFLQTKTELHGLILQLPLPKHLNEKLLTEAIDSKVDVDGFKTDSKFTSPIALAVESILKEIFDLEKNKKNNLTDWLKSQTIVVMGKGKTGGEPIISMLRAKSIEYKVIDSKTENPQSIIKKADILICAVGNKGTIINEHMIKKDAILIGIGMHKTTEGNLVGDYNPIEIKDIAKYYTPIPGGVGPVNAAMLLVNVLKSAENL